MGYPTDNLFGRYPDYGRVSGSCAPSGSINFEPVRESGFLGQLQEIPIGSQSTTIIFRFVNRFQGPYPSITRGEVKKNSKTLPKAARSGRGLNTGIVKIPGPPDILHSGHFPSSPPFQKSTETEKPSNGFSPMLRGHDFSGSSIPGRDGLVEGSPPSMEWQGAVPKTNRFDHRDRCISKGLGGILPGRQYRGPLEEKRLHINCLELLAGSLAIKTFTKDKVCAHVKLLIDNTAAVAYINKMGGTHSQVLSNLALDLWEWCIHNNVEVSAQHLPGHLNIRADRESRLLPDSSDWKLNPVMFQSLVIKWGPLEISSHSLSVGDRTP